MAGHLDRADDQDHDPETRRSPSSLLALIEEIQARVAELPVLDDRPADEILGYNARGHWD